MEKLSVAEANFEKARYCEVPSWTLEIVDFLGKVLDGRDMCHTLIRVKFRLIHSVIITYTHLKGNIKR